MRSVWTNGFLLLLLLLLLSLLLLLLLLLLYMSQHFHKYLENRVVDPGEDLGNL